MFILSLRKVQLLIAAAFLFNGFATALRAEEAAVFFGSVDVPAGLSAAEVKETIVAVISGRAWAVKEKTDGKVVGYLKHRSNEATVTLTFDTTKVDISCVGYEISKKTGERKKPEQPTGWLKNIRSDLVKRLNQTTATK